MPITTCTNPFHGKDRGYDPNTYNNSDEATRIHLEAHELQYFGCVIGIYERNMHDDSDFYAVVWDQEEERVKTIQYMTTRGWTYHNNATVDATMDALKAADDWTIRMLVKSATDNWSTPGIGKRVKSLTTRGKYVGVEGVILRIEDSDFNRYDKVAAVEVEGLRYPAKINVNRVQVLGEPDQDELLMAAKMRVANQGTMSVVRSWAYA